MSHYNHVISLNIIVNNIIVIDMCSWFSYNVLCVIPGHMSQIHVMPRLAPVSIV